MLIGPVIALSVAAGCSGASGGDSEARATDSIRRADSLARVESARRDSLHADSVRRDSLMRDSLFEANALRLGDFIVAGSNRFLDKERILANLERKGFVIAAAENHSAGNDSHATDYRLFAGGDSLSTEVTLRYSEPYAPMTITFVDDRSRDIFDATVSNGGFARDETGNYVHPRNTSWAAAIITASGRRFFMEWTTSD